MKRREFITALGGAAAAWPLAALAQQTDRARLVGILAGIGAEDDADAKDRFATFHQAMQQLGWIEGRNVRYASRARSTGNFEVVQRNAAELVALAPDAILVVSESAQDRGRCDMLLPLTAVKLLHLLTTGYGTTQS